jgi:hypothetical protein
MRKLSLNLRLLLPTVAVAVVVNDDAVEAIVPYIIELPPLLPPVDDMSEVLDEWR